MPEGKEMAKPKRVSFSVLMNLIMLIGLIVLYALYFIGIKDKQEEAPVEQMAEMEHRIAESMANIAWISSEQLMEQYELAVKMRDDFESEQRRMEADLERRQRSFQTEVERFQRNISAGSISMDQAQAREQELMLEQQELFQLSDTYRERLAQKEFEMNLELLEKVSDFLDRFNQEAAYDFILSVSRGGSILHAGKQHDITAEVINRLNAEYRLGQ